MKVAFVSGASCVAMARDVVTRKIQDEEVLLQLKTGRYFGLDEIGSRSWDLLVREKRSVGSAAEKLSHEYDKSQAEIEGDLIRLVGELKAAELICLE